MYQIQVIFKQSFPSHHKSFLGVIRQSSTVFNQFAKTLAKIFDSAFNIFQKLKKELRDKKYR